MTETSGERGESSERRTFWSSRKCLTSSILVNRVRQGASGREPRDALEAVALPRLVEAAGEEYGERRRVRALDERLDLLHAERAEGVFDGQRGRLFRKPFARRLRLADEHPPELRARIRPVNVVEGNLADGLMQLVRLLDDKHEVVVPRRVPLEPRAVLRFGERFGVDEPTAYVILIPPRERQAQV